MNSKAVTLLLSDAHGVYLPYMFVTHFDRAKWNLADPEFDWAWDQCSQPDSDDYWEAWDQIIFHAEYHEGGHVWTLCQDGDLWALCDELMTDEEKHNFGYEDY